MAKAKVYIQGSVESVKATASAVASVFVESTD